MATNWTQALIDLSRRANLGETSLEVLDQLGHAAYKTYVPEALSPFQNHRGRPMGHRFAG